MHPRDKPVPTRLPRTTNRGVIEDKRGSIHYLDVRPGLSVMTSTESKSNRLRWLFLQFFR